MMGDIPFFAGGFRVLGTSLRVLECWKNLKRHSENMRA